MQLGDKKLALCDSPSAARCLRHRPCSPSCQGTLQRLLHHVNRRIEAPALQTHSLDVRVSRHSSHTFVARTSSTARIPRLQAMSMHAVHVVLFDVLQRCHIAEMLLFTRIGS